MLLHIHIGKLPPCEDAVLTPQKQGMCELYHVSLYEYPSFCIRKTMPIFPFHFRCRDIFSWSGNIFSFSSSWTWKTTANFLWNCHRKQQTHLWLVHSEASFVFFVLLSSVTRKIWVCQCFYRAFDSHLIQNLAALSRCFFQPTLVHVSLS